MRNCIHSPALMKSIDSWSSFLYQVNACIDSIFSSYRALIDLLFCTKSMLVYIFSSYRAIDWSSFLYQVNALYTYSALIEHWLIFFFVPSQCLYTYSALIEHWLIFFFVPSQCLYTYSALIEHWLIFFFVPESMLLRDITNSVELRCRAGRPCCRAWRTDPPKRSGNRATRTIATSMWPYSSWLIGHVISGWWLFMSTKSDDLGVRFQIHFISASATALIDLLFCTKSMHVYIFSSNRAFSSDVMLSSNMAASIATEFNIHASIFLHYCAYRYFHELLH